ncbi:uncharacterized protein LACBIDRAFT_294891 [Laccaria bicolor S238N-H82]|uniref:Predicted protein n=1 Tax=Laccaria bicolor (strain S238N-H82 / ATCC MYA-4686) TaxID=486041 RepID=B0DJU3_LACBS|nr:uncharacterized protein LACBIDRAFT_294891 [Laccaria bicolor S238N-H82]EDR05179.1 predicted protein [Laccaria bicolor S238N-H82]|eukprot:XP_001884144.1 predicted protein [Laccaria bicolor S238N-H82]
MYRGRFNGKAASGTTAAGHAEDSQPNESINKRKQVAPPRIATVAPPRKSNVGWRGSYRGRGGWPQTAIRGDKGWRGGRGSSSVRGGQRSSGIYTSDSGQGGSGRTNFRTYTTAASTPPTTVLKCPEYLKGKGKLDDHILRPSQRRLARHPRYHPPLPRKTASSTQNLTQPYKPQFARHSSPPPLNEISFNRELQQSLSPRLITPDLPPLKRRKLDTEHEILVKEGAEEVPPPKPKPPLPKRSTRSGSAAFSSSPAFSTQPPPKSRPFEKELSPQVKAEPSSLSLSPPPPPPSRRLITESCTLFPIPDNCRKSYPTYYQNRKNLFREKVSWLAGFGLKKTRVFFRDDGMVVEWTSSTPVWSDTLMPEAPSLAMVIRSVHEANSLSPERLLQGKHASEAEAARASQESRKPASSKDHPKPKPSQRKFNPVPIPRRKPATKGSQVVEQGVGVTPERKNIDLASDDYSRRVRKEEDHATEVVEGLIPFRSMSLEEIRGHPVVKKEESPGFVPGSDVPRFASEDLVTQTLLHPEKHTSHQPTPIPDKDLGWKEVSTVWAELDTVALAFIDRYIRTFDSDRSKLEKAYTKNAIFSARIHTPSPPKTYTPFFSDSRLLASITTRKQIGRAQIIEYLNALGPHQFCPHGTMRNVAYTLMLHEGLVLMTVHGEVVNPGGGGSDSEGGAELDHVVSLDQSFVLRRPESDGKEEEGDGDSGEAAWPLEALSHQMTVREEPLLCLEGVEEALPWVAGIVGGGGDGVVVDDEHEDL